MEPIKDYLRKAILFFIAVVGVSIASMAQQVPGVHVYPQKNQSQDQQVLDENSCSKWAHQEMMNNPTPQEENKRHKTAKRSALGAGAGAIIGGGKGAAIGAGAGAISGHRSKKRDVQESQEVASSDFVRAYASCLKGKGYSVE
jgi:hypothetical protein